MNDANWKQKIKASVKGGLRRQRDLLLPSREVRAYQRWIAKRKILRDKIYTCAPEPGLFSILTPVWNGSPVRYLRALARSISEQNKDGACEWVVLDNGCSRGPVTGYLSELDKIPWVRVLRAETNVGITRGLRRCLEGAGGRYVMPVDADDLLYADALRVAASAVRKADYPALLYTDEDKAIGARRYQPYFKPDWDPVLLLNSAYIAHLGIINREAALALGAYSDPGTEGSPDWDLFVRFLLAGYKATHIPEIIYSWRVHAASTADDAATKPYIATSQKRVLERYLAAQPKRELFEVEESPLLPGGGHWRLRRRPLEPKRVATVRISREQAAGGAREYMQRARELSEGDGWLWLIGDDLRMEWQDWEWEAAGIADLHPDTVMVGGRIRDGEGHVLEAGMEFGFDGIYGSPNRGRAAGDAGYFGQMWKQRSVSAVSSQFAAIEARFLMEVLQEIPAEASLGLLGAWVGAQARRRGRRVVYSPFLSAVSETNWLSLASATEQALFRRFYGDLDDGRYYPSVFSRSKAFQLDEKAAHSTLEACGANSDSIS